jgi:hypothetical protein
MCTACISAHGILDSGTSGGEQCCPPTPCQVHNCNVLEAPQTELPRIQPQILQREAWVLGEQPLNRTNSGLVSVGKHKPLPHPHQPRPDAVKQVGMVHQKGSALCQGSRTHRAPPLPAATLLFSKEQLDTSDVAAPVTNTQLPSRPLLLLRKVHA